MNRESAIHLQCILKHHIRLSYSTREKKNHDGKKKKKKEEKREKAKKKEENEMRAPQSALGVRWIDWRSLRRFFRVLRVILLSRHACEAFSARAARPDAVTGTLSLLRKLR